MQSNAIEGDNFEKKSNEMIIFPCITVMERSINRDTVQNSQNKFVPFNGVQLLLV